MPTLQNSDQKRFQAKSKTQTFRDRLKKKNQRKDKNASSFLEKKVREYIDRRYTCLATPLPLITSGVEEVIIFTEDIGACSRPTKTSRRPLPLINHPLSARLAETQTETINFPTRWQVREAGIRS